MKKDSSTMAEIIMHGLHILKNDFQVDLARFHFWLQSDNTSRESKNNVIARLLGGLTSNGNFPLIICQFCFGVLFVVLF